MTWLLVVLAMGAVRPAAEQTAPRTNVRLHHLHYTVADPAAAMNRVAVALEGTRVLLQGLGVGVRVGDEYVLFDRADAAAPDVHAARTPAQAYRSAAAWLGVRGVRAPESFTGGRLAAEMTGEPLHHVAFAADSFEAARASLAAAGARPTRESADAIMFLTPDGVHVELLRPTDVEDAFWCPMHPDVRSGHAGVCPVCSMALVPIPPPRIGEYRMDVTVMPAADGKGMSGLRLVIRDPETGAPVPSFARVHERLVHLFIISRSLDDFAHVHPESIGAGTFELEHDAAPGEYMLIADFLPHGGVSQIVQRAIVTPGYTGPLMAPVPDPPAGPAERIVDGVRIAMDAGELAPRKPAGLRFTVTEALSGYPVTDLEPFLGAPAHLLIVRTDLTEAIHGHPDEDDTGSIVSFDPLMPTSGTYKLWVQFQRKGKVLTAPFVIEVPDR